MDYIREELLRQQALLVVLLTGQRLEPLEEAGRQTGAPAGPEWAPETERRLRLAAKVRDSRAKTPFGETENGAALLLAALAARETGDRTRETGWPTTPERLQSGGVPAETAEESRRAAIRAAEFPMGDGRAAGGLPGQTGEVRLVTEVHQAERGEPAGPAALSRAFQRDARRYDGGFRLY